MRSYLMTCSMFIVIRMKRRKDSPMDIKIIYLVALCCERIA